MNIVLILFLIYIVSFTISYFALRSDYVKKVITPNLTDVVWVLCPFLNSVLVFMVTVELIGKLISKLIGHINDEQFAAAFFRIKK
jgi:hypothetical protein